jgi:hypothetical protein
MSRPFAILLALGLLGATQGCHHTHGVCDCDPGPIGHGGPPPPLAAELPPLRLEPVAVMPKPAENGPSPAAAEAPK